MADGLPNDSVTALLPLPDGSILVGTGSGTLRCDGRSFVPWPSAFPKVARAFCTSLARGRDGLVWLATNNGLFCTDGTALSILDERDGLPEKEVTAMDIAADGTLWVGTAEKGLARFPRSSRLPPAPGVVVQTDREYSDLAALPRPLTGQRVTFKFKAVDFRTVPEKTPVPLATHQGRA
jgi:hypothetical protein